MKLNGQPLGTSIRQPFTLPRTDGSSLTLTLKPLSLGFHHRLRQRGIHPPTPPVKVARDSAGRPVRDASGQAVTLSDVQNHAYLAELERYHQRIAVLAVVEALRGDAGISFETPSPDEREANADEWLRYADTLFEELEQSGFSAGDLILLCQEICRISNLLDDHLAAAQANFSSPLPSGST
jgi:hypothetical protein